MLLVKGNFDYYNKEIKIFVKKDLEYYNIVCFKYYLKFCLKILYIYEFLLELSLIVIL